MHMRCSKIATLRALVLSSCGNWAFNGWRGQTGRRDTATMEGNAVIT
jgi:hypothetical protein